MVSLNGTKEATAPTEGLFMAGIETGAAAATTIAALKAIPSIASAGSKLFDFMGARTELAATQEQLADAKRELSRCRDEIRAKTDQLVALTDEAATAQKQRDAVFVEY